MEFSSGQTPVACSFSCRNKAHPLFRGRLGPIIRYGKKRPVINDAPPVPRKLKIISIFDLKIRTKSLLNTKKMFSIERQQSMRLSYAIVFSVLILVSWSNFSIAQTEVGYREHVVSQMSNYAFFIIAHPHGRTGTCFVYDADTSAAKQGYTLITNKHILEDADSVYVVVQLASQEQKGIDSITKRYSLYTENGDSIFVVHDSLDLAALYLDYIKGKPGSDYSIYSVKAKNIADSTEIFQGQRILFFGYPNNIRLNGCQPLTRQGIVAGVDQSPGIRGIKSVILIDAQVYGGSSGSPVFIDPVEGINDLRYFVSVIAGNIFTENYRIVDLKNRMGFSFSENTGLGYVMPAKELPVLAEAAKARYAKYRRK